MSRAIRSERARDLQGCRAGIVSRGLAFAADVGIAFAIYLGLVAGVNLARDLFASRRIDIPTPPAWFSAIAVFAVLVVYLALGWGATGRTVGKQLMGLRVVREDTSPLTPGVAFARAVFCALFYPGLLFALVDRRNRSLQDVVCRTVVVYDWLPESSRPRLFPTRASERAPTSGEERA